MCRPMQSCRNQFGEPYRSFLNLRIYYLGIQTLQRPSKALTNVLFERSKCIRDTPILLQMKTRSTEEVDKAKTDQDNIPHPSHVCPCPLSHAHPVTSGMVPESRLLAMDSQIITREESRADGRGPCIDMGNEQGQAFLGRCIPRTEALGWHLLQLLIATPLTLT
jgi:hypothetical protein